VTTDLKTQTLGAQDSDNDSPSITLCQGHLTPAQFNKAFKNEGWDSDGFDEGSIKHGFAEHGEEDGTWRLQGAKTSKTVPVTYARWE